MTIHAIARRADDSEEIGRLQAELEKLLHEAEMFRGSPAGDIAESNASLLAVRIERLRRGNRGAISESALHQQAWRNYLSRLGSPKA